MKRFGAGLGVVALGFALGGFWSLAPALCLRLVPQRLVARAISIIFTGVSAATVESPGRSRAESRRMPARGNVASLTEVARRRTLPTP